MIWKYERFHLCGRKHKHLLNQNNAMDSKYLKKTRNRQVMNKLRLYDRAVLKEEKSKINVYWECMCVYTYKIHFSIKIHDKVIPHGFK